MKRYKNFPKILAIFLIILYDIKVKNIVEKNKKVASTSSEPQPVKEIQENNIEKEKEETDKVTIENVETVEQVEETKAENE